MKNRLVLTLAAVVLMGAPAFAAIQNVKVSGDIDSTYLNRQNFALGTEDAGTINNQGLINQSAFITQTTLKVDADLSDNVSTTVGLINERAWDSSENATTTAANAGGNGSTFSGADTNVQLYLAYATLREFLYSPLTLTVGRQYLNYGNGLIIGAGANNAANGPLANVAVDLTKRHTFDAIKATLDYKPLTVDLLYFKNNANKTNSGGLVNGGLATSDDSDVYGIDANYQLGDAMNTVAEGYFFARINGKNATTGLKGDKNDEVLVPGLRVSTNPVKGLNTQVEVAWQGGRKALAPGSATAAGGDNIRRSAMAYQFMASYALPIAQIEKYKPTVDASFTHVSGDKNAGDARQLLSPGTAASRNVYTAWDPMFESQGGGTIYNTLFNLTNMNIASAGFSATPIQDVTAAFTWSGLWADKKVGTSNGINNPLTFLQPDGSLVAPATTSSKMMGNEYDVNVNYNYTEDVLFGVNLGWFVPGNLFNSANRDTASQAIAHVDVNF